MSSIVKKETDAHNKALAKRLGLKIVQTPERKIRLYRAQPVNPVFNPSSAANGEAQKEFAGKWFTPNIEKVDWYAHNASVKGVPAELQFVEIPESQLKKICCRRYYSKRLWFWANWRLYNPRNF